MSRPSYKEINRRIKQAKEAALGNRISIINPMSAAADLLELDINIRHIPNILIHILNEITPNDYVGHYPPQRSYADAIKDSELLAFQWLSKRLGCRVYFKFTIKENQLWLVSLHRVRKMRKE